MEAVGLEKKKMNFPIMQSTMTPTPLPPALLFPPFLFPGFSASLFPLTFEVSFS